MLHFLGTPLKIPRIALVTHMVVVAAPRHLEAEPVALNEQLFPKRAILQVMTACSNIPYHQHCMKESFYLIDFF